MGFGNYKGGTTHQHSMSENINHVSNNFTLTNGYFGTKGDSSKNTTRHLESDNPKETAIKFYDQIAKGGIEKKLPNGKGVTAKLEDGSIITMRPISSSDGSPAVDINIKKSSNSAGVKTQKIHFIKKGSKKK